MTEDLAPTEFIQSDHPAVQSFVDRVAGGATTDRETVARLFAAVRDEVRYNPYAWSEDPDVYRAANVLEADNAYCIPKAVLLTAAARAAGIPARLGFADVKNHLNSEKLREAMGTDMFLYHGFSVLKVDGEWRKASPAFNRELCAKFGVAPLDFDGTEDALLHAYTGDGERHMEYVKDRGTRADLPYDELMACFEEHYPHFGTGGEADSAFSS